MDLPGYSTDPLPVVGRERETGELYARLDLAFAGHGGLALVSGEAGIGKTTLVESLARHAEKRGALTLSGACYDLTATQPYGPWIEALGRYPSSPDLPPIPQLLRQRERLAEAGSQEGFFEQIVRFIATIAATRPLVLLLDDVHWADRASLDLLRYASRHAANIALLLVVTYRDDGSYRNAPLYTIVPHLIRETNPARLELRRLEPDHIRQLVDGRYALTDAAGSRLATYLDERTGGNPFFSVELLRELERSGILVERDRGWEVGDLQDVPVPMLVRQMIETRLDRLDRESRALLELAAVIGQDVEIDLWQRISGASDSVLVLCIAQGISAHLLVESASGAAIRFTHGLVREALYREQVAFGRRLQHRAIAEALAGLPEPEPGTVAHHFEQANDPRAVEWLIQAGERAYRLSASRDAVDYVNRAGAMAARFDQSLPVTAQRLRALASEMIGEFGQARHDHAAILERSRSSGDRRAEWQALLDLAGLWAARDYDRAGEYCRAALAVAREIAEPGLVASSLNRVANWHANLEELDTAISLHREALAIFESRDDQEGVAETLDLLGMTSYLRCDFEASLTYFEPAIALLRRLDDRARLSSSLVTISHLGSSLDNNVAAPIYREPTFWQHSLEEGLAIARDIGWLAGEAYALWMGGLAVGMRGDLGRARRWVEDALAIARRIDHQEWTAASQLATGVIWSELLDYSRAVRELGLAMTAARESGSRLWISIAAATRARVLAESGDLEQASAILQTVLAPEMPRHAMGYRECWFSQAGLDLAYDRPEHALEIVDDLLERSPAPPRGSNIIPLLILRGDVHATLGAFSEAVRDYAAARETAVLFGFTPLLWRIDAALARLARTRGRHDAAAEAVQNGLGAIEQIAATIPEPDIRDTFISTATMRLQGDPQDDWSGRLAAALTPRETDVLRLLVEGKSDREIADALFLSPRTVMRHVAGILTKFDVPSRTAAVAVALRNRLV